MGGGACLKCILRGMRVLCRGTLLHWFPANILGQNQPQDQNYLSELTKFQIWRSATQTLPDQIMDKSKWSALTILGLGLVCSWAEHITFIIYHVIIHINSYQKSQLNILQCNIARCCSVEIFFVINDATSQLWNIYEKHSVKREFGCNRLYYSME